MSSLLEACRNLPRLKHFVYASSSSVYGANTKLPFSVDDRTDRPVSLYGATKKAMEAISYCYAETYGLPLTGLRFFTVYGPWGRPDMARFLFTRSILAGEPIAVFNHGEMSPRLHLHRRYRRRRPRLPRPAACHGDAAGAPHRLYNLGNHRPERLMDFIAALERGAGPRGAARTCSRCSRAT